MGQWLLVGFMLIIYAALFALCALAQQPEGDFRVLKEWRFEKPGDLQGWTYGSLKDVKVEGGSLRGTPTSLDPILTSPVFELAANEFQRVQITLRCAADGDAQLFYSNTTQGQYGGFSGKKVVTIQAKGGPDFRTYDILPFWGPEKKIVHIRFDPPSTGPFEIRSIQIVEESERNVSKETAWDLREVPFSTGGVWRQRTSINADDFCFVALRMSARNASLGRLSYALDTANGLHEYTFPVRSDGRMHTYNLEPDTKLPWSGRIIYVALEFQGEQGADVRVESLKFTPDPEGPPDLEVRHFGPDAALLRAGIPTTITCTLYNHGADSAALVATLGVPEGVRIEGSAVQSIGLAPHNLPTTIQWKVLAERPLKGELRLTVAGSAEPLSASASVEFLPSLGLPKASYVPEPKLVDTHGYQVGVYYFPGWYDATRWAPIQSWPNRKPVLGWYEEGSPEVADWHIKWMLEHGITWIAYDWYWCKGARHLEHGLHDGFFKARYQHMIQFCLLYANHNPKGTTSVEDSIALTKFWIENYFKRPNYLRVEGKPVVIIFSTRRITEDIGHENVKPMFDKMDEVCRGHGIPGIYMVACIGRGSDLKALKEEGYSAVSGYNPGVGFGDRPMLPFSHLTAATERLWNTVSDFGQLKLIPPLSGGWDPRPWHGPCPHRCYPDRTPASFLLHCRAAKEFLQTREREPRLCIVEAWNEWGEGSYIEPHAEFGFGYLDAIREVFAPDAGPHVDITPADVGLGPYEVKPLVAKTRWDFDTDGDREGWTGFMHVGHFRVEGGCLKFEATGIDPAIGSPPLEVRASKFSHVRLRMKAGQNDRGQLFWATGSSSFSEQNSVHFEVTGGGAMHDYVLPVGQNRRWRGVIKALRLDPGAQAGNQFEIDSIALMEKTSSQ